MNENGLKYYEYLKSKGLDVPPTYESFQNTLNDPNQASKYYKYLQDEKNQDSSLDLPPNFDSFYNTLKKKDQFSTGSQTTQRGSGSGSPQFGNQEEGDFSFSNVKKQLDKQIGVDKYKESDLEVPYDENAIKDADYQKRIQADKNKYKFVSDEDYDVAVRKNPEIAKSDKFYKGAVPEIEGIPTTLFGGESKLEGAQIQRDYYENWDPDFESIPKQTSLFSDEDIKADPKKYQEAALNDYLEYLKNKNGEDSQTYLGTKEKIEYYKSLGDKLYNDGEYADDLKRFQDIQKTALSKIGSNAYAKAIKIENSYDWDYFSKKASDLQLKADLINKQIKELGITEGKVLSSSQQKKLNDLTSQYQNIQQEFSKLSEDTKIDNNVISQMENIQKEMQKIKLNIDDIDNQDSENAKIIREYNKDLEENTKAQQEFYNTKESGTLETAGKGVTILGQKAASSFVEGVFSMYNVPKIVGEAFGAKGYGWTDKMAEASENINSYVDKWSPKLNTGEMTNFMSAMSQMGEGLGSVATFLAGGSAVSKFGKGLNFSQKALSTANKAGQFAVASSLSASQMYNEFLQNEFTPEEASRYALGAGVVMGLAEMMVPEDELIANQLKGSFLSAVKSGATTKEAIQNGLEFIAKKSVTMAENMRKEGTEEFVGQLAESASKQVAEFGTGKKIDGIWNPDDFTKSALAGAGTAGIIDLFKFGSKTGKYANPFEENMVGYLAENYDDMIKKLSEANPEAYDQIADRYGKLKEVYNGLKNIPAFNELSKADQDHVLAQAHTKQVILENLKQSGLDKSSYKDVLDEIEQDIFLTLNKPKKDAIQETSDIKKEKTKEQTDWENYRTELEGKISDSDILISALENQKRYIYDKYGITDPKTQDISGLSNDDAIKIETINSQIQKEKKYKSREEVNLSIHNDNKPVIEDTEESPNAIHADQLIDKNKKDAIQKPVNQEEKDMIDQLNDDEEYIFSYRNESEIPSYLKSISQKGQTSGTQKIGLFGKTEKIQTYKVVATGKQIKDLYYAIQKPSSEEVLPRQQGETTETGGEPQGMGQSVQGEEVTQEGKQEEVSVNREPIAEDVAPEQKAKIEERNAQDEDEAVTEIYDFNDEIKSVGTKEQFKAFLRSLSPKGVFSRIAWHNSDKESLQPREGQYYTNTRRNAEETYKREFTHPAIIFGNAPQKMDFDQVQEFDINEIKSQGNDIVITDDLSPAIGAEMNYREFIPSSADQIIPIGTKENIEAFKAFVEQQKAATTEQVTEQVTEQATPQAQETEQEVAPEEEAKVVEEASKNEGIKPKNMQDLIRIYRKVFGLSFPKAVSAAMVSNRLVKQMAKRAGVTPEQMYQRLSFQKANEKDLPQGVKMQVDAWHGSPYEFDRFTTEKIGTGEGAQAFGWGLYFTDLKNIAQAYAKALSGTKFKGVKLDDNPIFDKLLSNLDAEDESFYNYDTGQITNLSKFKDYIYDRYNYLNNLSKNIDENHPLVKRFLSDSDYSQEKLNAAKENLKSIEDKNINIYKMLIDNGVPEKEAKALADSFYESKKKSREFIYEAMKYQASRENLVKKSINFVKNDLKSDLNYFKYLKDNFDKFELSRYLYKVSLQKGKDTNQYTWLEWDKKPNKDQVNNLLSKLNQNQIDKGFYYGLSPDETNGSFYKKLSRALGSDKAASLFLLENGIDGVKYPAESISRGATSETARGFNYVVFDENAVSIEEVIKFQKDAEKARGAMMIGMDGQAIIYALTDPNISTPLHELAHVFEHYLTDAEKNQIIKAAKTKGWTTETSEYFARGFEKYLAEGKSNNPIFEKFKQFLLDVYKAIKGSPIDVKLNKQMKAIYAEMLGEDITQGEVQEEVEVETDTELESIINEFKAAQQMEGIDKLDKMNELKEKYGEIYEKMTFIDSNFDELLDKFNAVRICNFEP